MAERIVIHSDLVEQLKEGKQYEKNLKQEHGYNNEVENEIWKEVGFLQLIAIDKTNLKGSRLIFKLIDETKKNILKKQTKYCRVSMCEVRERDGKYKDVSFKYVGTLIERHEDGTIMIEPRSSDRHMFEHVFKVGELFRFERCLEQQKHEHDELVEHTLYRSTQRNVGEIKLIDIINSRMRPEGEELKDRGSQKYVLNDSQYNALKMALNDKRDFVCIEGPPGTGKTYVLAHLLATLLFRKKKAIVLAPTREALKNIMLMTERVIKDKHVLYHDKSLMDSDKFEQAVNASPAAENARNSIAQMDEMFTNAKISSEQYFPQKKQLINCTFAEEGSEVMNQTSIVFATLQSNFVNRAVRYKTFDPCMCVIDNAEQVLKTQTWPAVLKMKRLVMAGDPKQFLAFALPSKGKYAQIEKSIMNSIIQNKEKFSWITLHEQYRCLPGISVWSNKSFYGRALADKTDPNKTIHNSFKIKAPTAFRTLFDAAVLVDTSAETDPDERVAMYELISGESYQNELGNSCKSFKNEGEAELVLTHYAHLRELGIEAKDIAIIAPYKGQIELIAEKLENYMDAASDFSCKQTTIGTVDSVQGQQYDCVIFSMVRSNPKKSMGLVKDLRRLNVVMTRAKRHLMFIGNGYLMSNSYQKEIQDLFHEFNSTRHRFHPQHVRYVHAQLYRDVRNNFGLNFEAFVNVNNDPKMKEWCAAYVQRQSDPLFQLKQQERRAKLAQPKSGQNGDN